MSFGSSSLEDWLKAPASIPPSGTSFIGLNAQAQAILISKWQNRVEPPILTIFNSSFEARSAIDNISFFVGSVASTRIHYFPPTEFDFHRNILPNLEVLCERNVALFHALNNPGKRCFVTTVAAMLQRVFPPIAFLESVMTLEVGKEYSRDILINSLLRAGYQEQPSAYDPGVFSVRGGVVDIFSPLHRNPIRVEYFGDTVEDLRFFDPVSQRSLDKLPSCSVIPVGLSLVPTYDNLNAVSEKIKTRLDQLEIGKSDRDSILGKVRDGAVSGSLSLLFPLISGGSSDFCEYLPADTHVFWNGIESAKETLLREHERLKSTHQLFESHPAAIAPLDQLISDISSFEKHFTSRICYFFEPFSSNRSGGEMTLDNAIISLEKERKEVNTSHASQALLDSFSRRFKNWFDEGFCIHIIFHTSTHADKFIALFEPYKIRCQFHSDSNPESLPLTVTHSHEIHLWLGYITQSQVYKGLRLVILSEEEIFGKKKRVSPSKGWSSGVHPSRILSTFRDLKVNDLVVHRDQGIGRYLGLRSMNFLGVPNDYVLLEYRDGDKLYIPIYRLNIIQKYVGSDGTNPFLDKMGGDRWIRAKKKAESAAALLAAEFLDMQARRKLIPAFSFSAPGNEFREFEMEFPFDETPDQLRAIEQVMEDMGKQHPMDRLVCGDVGYGKTEVAIRATYRCALDGKQAAILVPTTILAYQHFETFKSRFQSTAVRVEMVSRLRSTSQTKQILSQVREGRIDILIGTHRLLSSDIVFKDLGLLVVDEEHRFGVVHKEKIRKMVNAVHTLTMTATPIPRTLNMAMTGIKDISLITTPPPDRLSVRTFVCKSSPEVIREAIQQELSRGGQVFFVHNRIESLPRVVNEIKEMFPKVGLEFVHGQMDPEELEKKMFGFYHGEFSILVTTAIIESGLDIPRANTIILDDAHTLGLAQLYQLRGRVGRSDRRAYSYLLVPGESQLTEEAKERLQVIQRHSDLGSGFNVASHDLEIRGVGNLLGSEQSGHLNAVGVDMYFELLEESIRALQGQEKMNEIEPEINLKIVAYFPDDYLPDIGERINIYRRLSASEGEERIAEIETEIRDRFGNPPVAVINLLGLMRLKLYLKKLHVVRLSCGPKKTSLQFAPTTPANPVKLVSLVQKGRGAYTVTPDQKLVFQSEETDWKGILMNVERVAHELGVSV